jgi:hypothetical protein
MRAADLLVRCLASEGVDYRENLKLTEELGRLVCPL